MMIAVNTTKQLWPYTPLVNGAGSKTRLRQCAPQRHGRGEGGQRILRAAVITVKLQNTHHGHSTVGVTTL